ncbi:hypothetical protein Misp01_46730 [Microtetraspora sp. NBRC 13810]|nr:hypothetical protein Misp01_46730 [Microtetraspora sp. NBRC 13810]
MQHEGAVLDTERTRFLVLVRLAWELRGLGVAVSVEMAPTDEPWVRVPVAGSSMRVVARPRGDVWELVWGRGRNQWVDASEQYAARLVRQAALRRVRRETNR